MPDELHAAPPSPLLALAGLDLRDPASVKRLLVLLLGLGSVAFGGRLGLSELQMELIAGMVVAFVGLSNLKAVALARAAAAGAAAASAVATDADAAAVLNAPRPP